MDKEWGIFFKGDYFSKWLIATCRLCKRLASLNIFIELVDPFSLSGESLRRPSKNLALI